MANSRLWQRGRSSPKATAPPLSPAGVEDFGACPGVPASGKPSVARVWRVASGWRGVHRGLAPTTTMAATDRRGVASTATDTGRMDAPKWLSRRHSVVASLRGLAVRLDGPMAPRPVARGRVGLHGGPGQAMKSRSSPPPDHTLAWRGVRAGAFPVPACDRPIAAPSPPFWRPPVRPAFAWAPGPRWPPPPATGSAARTTPPTRRRTGAMCGPVEVERAGRPRPCARPRP